MGIQTLDETPLQDLLAMIQAKLGILKDALGQVETITGDIEKITALIRRKLMEDGDG